tara:strand:+ start:2441 stop:3025 length:585 start_codon:yes stop_codon:yes gene_type:complete
MMETSEPDRVKQETILGAAMAVLCQYGYRRTSMEDIAQAAGMSRPALYQHFRNKENIARCMVQVYFDQSVQAVTQALAGQGTVPDLLRAGYAAKTGPMIRDMLDSPHGAELLDLKNSQARDLVEDGSARITAVFADWLTREVAAGRVTLDAPAGDTATVLLRALDGIKRPPYARFVAERDQLATLLGRGLQSPL